jgi:hypothetical protein
MVAQSYHTFPIFQTRAVTLLGVVAHFAPKGSPDPAIGPPDLAIRLEQGRIDGGGEPATLNGETTQTRGMLHRSNRDDTNINPKTIKLALTMPCEALSMMMTGEK